jgi:hypothetical protein
MAVRNARFQSGLYFLLNEILIVYCRSQIFELCNIFKGSVGYPYVIILPCILVMRQQHILQLSVHAGSLLMDCFYPEDGGDAFLRNVG